MDENEVAVKLELLRIAERIVCSKHVRGDDAADLKEIYRMLVALYNEKL
jgi:hypothetical protein